jgi:hypothetical protein
VNLDLVKYHGPGIPIGDAIPEMRATDYVSVIFLVQVTGEVSSALGIGNFTSTMIIR